MYPTTTNTNKQLRTLIIKQPWNATNKHK